MDDFRLHPNIPWMIPLDIGLPKTKGFLVTTIHSHLRLLHPNIGSLVPKTSYKCLLAWFICPYYFFYQNDNHPVLKMYVFIQRLKLGKEDKKKTERSTFNTRLQKISSFGTFISSNYCVNCIICSLPKGFKIHVLSLSIQKANSLRKKQRTKTQLE